MRLSLASAAAAFARPAATKLAPLRALATSAAAPGMRARPLCYADAAARTIDLGGGVTPVAPGPAFFVEVADDKAVADAAKYVNKQVT